MPLWIGTGQGSRLYLDIIACRFGHAEYFMFETRMLGRDAKYTGYFFVLLAAVCWAMLGTVARVPLSHGISPLEVAFWRAFFGALFFVVHGLACGLYHVKLKDGLILSGFGIFGVAMLFAVMQVAIQRGGVALAVILLYTAPFWVAVFSRIFFKEQLTPLKIIALVIALAGVSLICLSGGGLPEKAAPLGLFCGLLSGFAYSLHYVFCKAYLGRFSAVTIYMYCIPVGALILFLLTDFTPKVFSDWLSFICLGFVSTYAAYWAYCESLRRLSPIRVAVLCNLEPMISAALAFMFWDELFAAVGIAGAFMVFGAIFMIMSDKKS